MTVATLTKNLVCRVTYKCRDIGYGVESGSFEGYWTGEVDTWGKRTFHVIEHFLDPDGVDGEPADVLYLFPDEIVSVEGI